MLPIWLIYFMPIFWLVLLVVRVVRVGIAAIIMPKLPELGKTELFLKGILFAFLADLAGLAVFAAVCIWDAGIYSERYPLICAVSFAVAILSQFLLHHRFGFKECSLSIKQRIWMSVIVVAAAAPYFFFVPE